MAVSLDENLDMKYSIKTKEYMSDFTPAKISVIGTLRQPIRYNLKDLMESANPKHKAVLKSLVIDTIKNNESLGFKCLLHGNYQVQPLNDNNQTALHLAHYRKSTSIIAKFEEYLESDHCNEPDYTDYIDINGLSHLHVACAHASLKLVENYCKNSASINTHFVAPNKKNVSCCNGFTPLHFAMINFSHHSKEMVELLVKYGADVNAVDSKGRTPLHLISCISIISNLFYVTERQVQVMKALIDNGANVNIKDSKGNVPLFCIFSITNDREMYLRPSENAVVKFIEFTEMKLKILLDNGADESAKNNNSDTVWHFAVKFLKIITTYDKIFDSNILQSLELIAANQEIDVNTNNNDDETPLTLAISYLSVSLVQFFLKHNADVTNLSLNCKTDEFFKYPSQNILLERLKKLITILKLLWDEGCVFKPKDNLTVLKFLVSDCITSSLRDYEFKSEIFHMTCIESPKHLEAVCREVYKDFNDDYFEKVKIGEGFIEYFDDLNMYLWCINKKEVFIDEHSKTLIRKTLDQCIEHGRYDATVAEEFLSDEVEVLESIKLTDTEFLTDILKAKPQKLSGIFKKIESIEKNLKNLYHYRGIVVGHMILGMIRYYVVQLAYNCTLKLHSPPLPYICYELVMNELSNSDIFNLCLALMT